MSPGDAELFDHAGAGVRLGFPCPCLSRDASGWPSFQGCGYVNEEDVLWRLLSQGAHLELVRPALAAAYPDFDVDAEVDQVTMP